MITVDSDMRDAQVDLLRRIFRVNCIEFRSGIVRRAWTLVDALIAANQPKSATAHALKLAEHRSRLVASLAGAPADMVAAVGLLGAVGYTALMMAGLRTWWVDAVGTTAMYLHIVPATLVTGFVTSVIT